MSKRMVDTNLWNNEDIIENFTAEDKYFWLYLLTSPHNNICGVFKNTPALIARDMGLHKDTVVNLLYRFEHIHGLIYADKGTNEVIILNWYKFNWTKSPKIVSLVEKEMALIKSEKIAELLTERMEEIFIDKDTLSIGYRYLPNSNTNNSKYSNIISVDKITEYFNTTYEIYPRKVSKVQAKKAFEKKLKGLECEKALEKVKQIYRLLKAQISVWEKENNGEGRKTDFIPHFGTWLNANVEDSKK